MKLLQPYTLGSLKLKNRMVMAAMTRSRADSDGIVGAITAEYYAQRASAGLILSEAINISADALGSPLTPGLFTAAQIASWKQVTAAVHAKDGLIFAQLWHTGRVAHSVDHGGVLPAAPSAVKIEGMQHFTSQGAKDFETPRELTAAEIRQIIADYAQAAKNAIAAGFDGVELHAANGYLPQQFLSDSANLRQDQYGGSIENKARFTLEAMRAIIDAVGGGRVGIKISPLHPYAGIAFDKPVATYQYLINELNKLEFRLCGNHAARTDVPIIAALPAGQRNRAVRQNGSRQNRGCRHGLHRRIGRSRAGKRHRRTHRLRRSVFSQPRPAAPF